jgi:hypothetical protein
MDAAGLGDKNMDGAVRSNTFLLIYVAKLVFLVFFDGVVNTVQIISHDTQTLMINIVP